jgi:hypothetical protein
MRFSVGGIFSVWKGEPGNKKFCGTFHNHVTDYGMNTMVTKSLPDLTTTLHVGSGSTPPANEDLILESEVASTTNTSVSVAVSSEAKGYVGYRRRFEFSAGEAEGTLSELGLSDGVSLFNRQLFLGQDGNPTTLVIGATDALDIICEVRIYSSPVDTKISNENVTIGGVVFDHMCVFKQYYFSYNGTPSHSSYCWFTSGTFGDLIASDFRVKSSVSNYNDGSSGFTSWFGGTTSDALTMETYVNGSFEVIYKADFYAGTLNGEIDEIAITSGAATNIGIGLSPGYNIYSETEWQPSTSYNLDDMFIPEIGDEFIYKVTTAGTSHTEAPTWPTTIGETVTCSGGVEYECVAPLLVVDDTEALTLTIKISWTRE